MVVSSPGALAAALAFRPDVASLDLGMPQLNGYDLARVLRAEPALAGLVLVALCGWGTDADRSRSREVGIDRHLTKPVQLDDVERILFAVKPTMERRRTGH